MTGEYYKKFMNGLNRMVRSKVFLAFMAIVMVYSLLVIVPTPAQETLDRYDLSASSARILNATLLIPIALVWYVAIYGYLKLERYNNAIAGSKDGLEVAKIKNGILVLALGLPLSSIVSAILQLYIRSHPQLEPQAIIIKNYFSMLVPLVAFSLISWGARGLANLVRRRPAQRALNIIVFVTLLIGLTYVYLIARAPGTIAETFHLTLAPFLFTLILPYTYAWFLGLFGAYEIFLYSHRVKGVVYRDSWRLLSYGLVAIVIFSITLQYLGTLSTLFTGLSLSGVLIVIYLLLALWAASYILVAVGAKKLMKIEEA